MAYISYDAKKFFLDACKWADATDIQTAKKWWNAFHEVIVRELFFRGKCSVPDLGVFTTKKIPVMKQKQRVDGHITTIEIPAHYVVKFESGDVLSNDVNMEGITAAYRRRVRQGTVSRNDELREARAECMRRSKADRKNAIAYERQYKELLLAKARKSPKERVDVTDEEE